MRNGPFVRVTGTMLLTGFLLLSLGFAVEGTFETRAQIANTFTRQSQIQQAQIDLEELLRLQIDEENSLRGYLLTRDPFYTAEYRSASAGYDAKEDAIRKTLGEQELPGADKLLIDYAHLQLEWRDTVAAPLLAHPRLRLQELDKRNKLFADYETLTAAAIRRELESTGDELALSTQEQLDRSSYLRAAWVLVFGVFAIVLNTYRSRLNRSSKRNGPSPRFSSGPLKASRLRCRIATSAAPTYRRAATSPSAGTCSTSIAFQKTGR